MKNRKVFFILALSVFLVSGCAAPADSESDAAQGNGTLDGSSQMQSASVENGEAASEGLEYLINFDGNSYAVMGKGSCADADVVIPNTYLGKPVTMIAEDAFAYTDGISSVLISESVTKIEPNAFFLCADLEAVTFEGDATWQVLTSDFLIAGEAVDVRDPAQNAVLLTTTYKNYYWRKA